MASIIISITNVLKIWPTISTFALINHHITNIDRPLMRQIDRMCYCKAGFHIKRYYIYNPWHLHISTATDRSFLEHINTAKKSFLSNKKCQKQIYQIHMITVQYNIILLALTSFLIQCLIKLLMHKCQKTFHGFDMHASV